MPELFAIGLGYSISPLVKPLLVAGWRITGTTRSAEKADMLAQKGVHPLIWEAPAPFPAQELARADAVVISAAPDDKGCPAAQAIEAGGLKAGVRLIYLSSSGVYGDFDGDWIDESAACQPTGERGRRRLLAEADWRSHALGQSTLTICRLAGIYGPGRNAIESLLGRTSGRRAGLAQRVIKPGQVFNRIHQEDIAAGLLALLEGKAAPEIINFADDEPSPPQDVVTYAAQRIGMVPPPEIPFAQADLSPMARSFYADNKRLRNDRLKALLGGGLKFPNYRDGLDSIWSRLSN